MLVYFFLNSLGYSDARDGYKHTGRETFTHFVCYIFKAKIPTKNISTKTEKKHFCAITLLSLYFLKELKAEQAYRFPM